ncbi:hypothetical protein JZ785_27005 [Alicyclobacillus curvatus]|nr:hypothetical protein JZ785_27005 [Alicyclobacillus curvatus]
MDNSNSNERKVIKLVRATNGRTNVSGEGLLKGKDGTTIHDDRWLHADVLDEDDLMPDDGGERNND